MRKAGGSAVWSNADGTTECDTFTCTHCNTVVFVRPKTDPASLGGFCRLCYKHICGPCADKGVCTPFEKKLEEVEARDRLRRSILG